MPEQASPGKPQLLQPQRVGCTRRAPDPSLCYLSFVHLPQVPKDVQAGRGEMRPHSARAYHGGVSGGPGGPPAPSVTHSCGAPAGPAHQPASWRPRDQNLSCASGNRSLVRLRSPLGPGGTGRVENYNFQNATGGELRPVKTQGSRRAWRTGSEASVDPSRRL